MYKQQKTGKRGFIKWIIIIIIALVLASYFFDFSVQNAIEDEQTQQNFGYLQENAIYIYDIYLRSLVEYLWYDVFIDLLWNPFIEALEAMRNGEPTVFHQAAQSQIELIQPK
ncbi:hypothetical protein KC866_02860 [Patescibacteria group bacterium]|nr:hypothetical protein [Patescibacteria group bacterium]